MPVFFAVTIYIKSHFGHPRSDIVSLYLTPYMLFTASAPDLPLSLLIHVIFSLILYVKALGRQTLLTDGIFIIFQYLFVVKLPVSTVLLIFQDCFLDPPD